MAHVVHYRLDNSLSVTSHVGKQEAKKVEHDTENKGGREAAKGKWDGLCWNERKKS